MKRIFFKNGFLHQKFRRFTLPFAVFVLMFGACSSLGTRLGLWSTPSKSGLLPYEAPNFYTFKELLIHEAFAS